MGALGRVLLWLQLCGEPGPQWCGPGPRTAAGLSGPRAEVALDVEGEDLPRSGQRGLWRVGGVKLELASLVGPVHLGARERRGGAREPPPAPASGGSCPRGFSVCEMGAVARTCREQRVCACGSGQTASVSRSAREPWALPRLHTRPARVPGAPFPKPLAAPSRQPHPPRPGPASPGPAAPSPFFLLTPGCAVSQPFPAQVGLLREAFLIPRPRKRAALPRPPPCPGCHCP